MNMPLKESLDRIWTIVDKEWAEVFKNKVVLLTIGIMPLIFTILPLVVLSFFGDPSLSGGDSTDMPAMFSAACTGMAPSDCLQVYMVNEFLILFMMMPLAIPIAIASYSIVGEKTTHSLEPLLATPVTTFELLSGKVLAAAIPAIIATWGSFAIFILLVPLTGVTPAVQAYIRGATWFLAVVVAGPLMSILATVFAVIVSSRVSDPRVAEQTSMILILPVLALMFGQIAGLIVVNVQLMVIVIILLIFLDLGMVYVGTRMFERETILTKWR
jgi:ABC-2 type transport system permease protein